MKSKKLQIIKTIDYEVAFVRNYFAGIGGGETDDIHSSIATSLKSAEGVFEDDAVSRCYAQLGGSLQVAVGERL